MSNYTVEELKININCGRSVSTEIIASSIATPVNMPK